ncbi:phage late control D family protein [Microvirga sp. RSM25]|uniref:phage late control D family protein n=1 Tax=Microvirga sp. RSM25 TaxID=3273802 RepID=UPI00384DEDE6
MASHITVSLNGAPISDDLLATVISVAIKDAAGSSSDTCEITLDDADDQIAFPSSGDRLEVEIWRDGAEGAAGFEGVLDEPRSQGARGGGQVVIISGKAADMRGGLKDRKEKHKDDATLEEAAKTFVPKGYSIKFGGDLGTIRRDYWHMGRENFLHWAHRTAREIGATFKVIGKTAVFTPRNAGQSASGQPLQTIQATRGVNIINWDLAPDVGRPQRGKFEAVWYDATEAKWKNQRGEVKALGAEDSTGTSRFSAADQDTAEQMAGALEKEAAREKGGGSITIDGEPAAQAEAECVVSIRAGVSGTYRIDSVEHKWTRAEGFTTTLDLKQPGKGTGKDGRGKTPSSGGTGVLDE